MIRADIKRLVRTRFALRCGYCGVADAEVGAELTYDHFKPQSKGGTDDAENIVYACHACNEYKGDYFGDADDTRLLHPLSDNISDHVAEQNNGVLTALTDAGRRYLERLHLNRPQLVARRRDKRLVQNALQERGEKLAVQREILARLRELTRD